MTEYGLTADGFRRKPIEVIDSQIRARILGTVSGAMLLEPTEALGAMYIGIVDALDQLWGETERSHNGLDPGKAVGQQVVSLAKTVGKIREGASKGLVTEAITNVWPEGTTIAPGTILVSVAGNTANSWTNRDLIVIGPKQIIGGVIQPGIDYAVLQSTIVGSQAIALANQITKIVTNLDGMLSVNNPEDATSGKDEQTIEELRLGFYKSRSTGSGTLSAIESAVNKVPGVITCTALANSKNDPVNGIPPHSMRIIVWDGETPAANNVDICRAIYEKLPPGTGTTGSYSYTFTLPNGSIIPVYFDRAVQVDAYVGILVYGVSNGDAVKAAILELQPMPGKPLTSANVLAAAMGAGCSDADTPVLFIDGSALSTRLTPMIDQILLLDSARITVSIG